MNSPLFSTGNCTRCGSSVVKHYLWDIRQTEKYITSRYVVVCQRCGAERRETERRPLVAIPRK